MARKNKSSNEELSNYLRPLQSYIAEREKVGNITLMQTYKTSADPKERERVKQILIYGNILLVIKIAIAHADRGVPLFDLIQEGVFGLIKSIEKFRIEKGFQLSTYASWWIRQTITRAIDQSYDRFPYRIPINVQDEIGLVSRAIDALYEETGYRPNDLEIFKRVQTIQETFQKKTSKKRVAIYHELIHERHFSFDANYHDNDLIISKSMTEIIGDQHVYSNVENLLQARQHQEVLLGKLNNVIRVAKDLPERQALILLMRFGLDGHEPQTLEQIGKQFNLSRERIRQIESAGRAIIERQTGFSKKAIIQMLETIERIDHLVKSLN